MGFLLLAEAVLHYCTPAVILKSVYPRQTLLEEESRCPAKVYQQVNNNQAEGFVGVASEEASAMSLLHCSRQQDPSAADREAMAELLLLHCCISKLRSSAPLCTPSHFHTQV